MPFLESVVPNTHRADDTLVGLRPERVECGNPACSAGWLRTWRKDRRRPILEGEWGCSARCLNAMADEAVRREARDGRADGEMGQHRHRVPLGLLLLANGLITHPQLQHALAMQRRAGTGKIGRWLVDEFGLEEQCVTRALSVQWSCPVLSADGIDARAMALAMPRVLVEAMSLVPLRIVSDKIMYVGFEDRMDASAALALERMSGLKVESGLVDGTQLATARRRLLESEFVQTTIDQASDESALAAKIAATLGAVQPRASRLVRLHGFYWLRMWMESGAMGGRGGGVPDTSEDMQDRVYTIAH
jgi:hypothetical protein